MTDKSNFTPDEWKVLLELDPKTNPLIKAIVGDLRPPKGAVSLATA
jgi:hypothetical protein